MAFLCVCILKRIYYIFHPRNNVLAFIDQSFQPVLFVLEGAQAFGQFLFPALQFIAPLDELLYRVYILFYELKRSLNLRVQLFGFLFRR